MPKRAWLYIATIIVAGTIAALAAFLGRTPIDSDVLTLLVLGVLATISQLTKSVFESKRKPDEGTFSISPLLMFLSAGILLLPTQLYVLLVLIPHLIEWIVERWRKSANLPFWYIQPFNIAVHILCGLIAVGVYNSAAILLPPDPVLSLLFAGLAGVCVYVLLNHLLVGGVLALARGVSLKQSGALSMDSFEPDLMMVCMGVTIALLWQLYPPLILLNLAPIVMILRALAVPQLKQQARVDGKTGLWNANYFANWIKAEFQRAQKLDHSIAVIMADIDLLRNINNTYGHLAGDLVLQGVGQIINDTVGEYDLGARFGGEEFVIALAEAKPGRAEELAERIRRKVEASEFHSSHSATPIRATISLGVACYPEDADTVNGLIHAADIAVYQAKLQGRNRIVSYSRLPHSLAFEVNSGSERLSGAPTGYSTYTAKYEVGLRPSSQVQAKTEGVPVGPSRTVVGQTRDVAASADRAAALAQSAVNPEHVPSSAPKSTPHRARSSQVLLTYFLTIFVGLGIVVSLVSLLTAPPIDFLLIGLLMILAIVAESVHLEAEDNSVSVSVAINFAAALLAGVPGLVLVSVAIAITHRLRQPLPFKTALYKTGFNWANHLLSGIPVVVVLELIGRPADTANLAILLVPIATASLLYFMIESGSLAFVVGLSSGENILDVWQGNYRWVLGHYLVLCLMGLMMAVSYSSLSFVGLIVFAIPPLMMRYAQKQYVDRTRDSVRELKRMNQELVRANGEIGRASQSIKQLNDELFRTLGQILDARDPYVSEHAVNVARYAAAIATELALPEKQIEDVRQAAFLHDIGKLAISEQILTKPGRLTAEEYEILKTHSAVGADFLKASQGLAHLAPAIRHHHEHWNGKGYPDGLAGEQIPLHARILAVCDAVDAMASDRPYHRAMPSDEIIAGIQRCSGTQFDPEIVDVLVRIVQTQGNGFIVNSADMIALDSSLSSKQPHSVWASG